MTRVAIIVFPGSNCDADTLAAARVAGSRSLWYCHAMRKYCNALGSSSAASAAIPESTSCLARAAASVVAVSGSGCAALFVASVLEAWTFRVVSVSGTNFALATFCSFVGVS